jgi:hypothetical protein
VIVALAVVVAWSAGQEKLSLSLASARDRTSDGIAFVEVRTPRPKAWVGETVRVEVAFGLEAGFADREMVQPFGVRLDVPVQLAAPWLVARPAEAGSTFALDDGVQRAAPAEDRIVDGRQFRVHALEGTVLATSSGKLELPAPTLAFAYATRFEESALFGRTPVDRVDAYVRGAPLALDVEPLPEAGRPPEFTGAVGTFTVQATVEPHEVEMGESLRLRLAVRGDGDLSRFGAPAWTELGGFRVVGTADEKSPTVRTLTYLLAPLSEKVWQVPAIAFASFDPEPPAGYRVVRTESIVVVVRPRHEAPVPQDPEGASRAWPWAVAVGALALAVFVAVRRR